MARRGVGNAKLLPAATAESGQGGRWCALRLPALFFFVLLWLLLIAVHPGQRATAAAATDFVAARSAGSTVGVECEGGGAVEAPSFWHVTDWHLNLHHSPRADVRDMCRSPTPDASRWPGPRGHFNCDPSRALAQLAARRMSSDRPAPSFVLLGGDSHGHVPPSVDGREAVTLSHRAACPLHPLCACADPSRTPPRAELTSSSRLRAGW